MIKTIATAAATALIVCLVAMLSGLVGGNSQPGVGGESRFPNSAITAQGLTLSKAGTTTLSTGKVCMVVSQTDGDTSYAFFNSAGTLATSSTSCL